MVANPHFYTRKKNFYLQVEPDIAFIRGNYEEHRDFRDDRSMHLHYYWIKKALRKRELPLFPYKIRASDYKGEENV